MIKIDTEEKLPEVPDVTIWADDKDPAVFYALPDSPRMRTRNGVPQFKFIKYRGETGEKKGGFVFFDADLSLTSEEITKLKEVWQARLNQTRPGRRNQQPPQARMGTITYTRGSVGLNFESDSAIVSRIAGAVKPSLYGSNVAPFMLELDESQVPILEAAMQGTGSSVVQVKYDLFHMAAIPPATVDVKFNARRFESFIRTTDVEDSFWRDDHYNDKIDATLRTKEIGHVTVRVAPLSGSNAEDQAEKLKTKLRDWGFKMYQDAIAKQAANLLGLIPEEQKGASQTYMDKLGGDDLDDLHIELRNRSFVDFEAHYRETSPVEWNIAPSGSLPTIESMTGADGEPFKWEDFVVEVEPDAFFEELHVYAKVNADFDRLPIHSVQINIEHDGEKLEPIPLKGGADEHDLPLIEGPDDVLHFADFTDGVDEFDYWYQVNYENQSKVFESERKTIRAADREPLVINLDETGVLSLDVMKGDIDFNTVELAEVVISYEDGEVGPFVERYFIDATTTDAQSFQRVTFGPRKRPFEYDVTKLRLSDGTEISGPKGEVVGPILHVDDTFTAGRMIRCSAAGDLENDIKHMDVTINYTEPGYSLRESFVLDASAPIAEWPIRVTSLDAGTITYEGLIFRKDGDVRTVGTSTPPSDTFIFGEVVDLRMQVTVVPEQLFADPNVRMVIFSGSYTDPDTQEIHLLPNQIVSRKDGEITPMVFDWELDLRDDQAREYKWKATVVGGDRPSVEGTSTDPVLMPTLS